MTADTLSLRPRPELGAPGPWSFPDADVFTLDTGLTVRAYHLPGQHVISVGLALDLPLTAEPADKEGVAALTAACLDQGTRTHPGTSFADAVENCGAVLEATVTYAGTQAYLDVPATHLGTALTLLVEAVREPELSDADVDRERSLALADLEQRLANGSSRADREARIALIDPACRASRRKGGEQETLTTITGEDVRRFHQTGYGPTRATVVVAGDLPADVRQLVTAAFGTWTNPAQRLVAGESVRGRERVAVLVHRPGAVQADVRIGRFTIDRTDPRWADYQLAVHVLGGAFLSRLNVVLREEKGYTYGVHLTNAPLRAGGYTVLSGSFRNEVVADAVALAGPLLAVDAKPLTADELDRSRRYLMGVQPLQYATASGVCNGVLTLLSAGLEHTFVDDLRRRWTAVTPESATEAAAELLPADDLTVVVVGDADALEPDLRAAGFDVQVVGR